MIDPTFEQDFDEFRNDFVSYLAGRLGLSEDEALRYLGDWLSTFHTEVLAKPRERHGPRRALSGSSEAGLPPDRALDVDDEAHR